METVKTLSRVLEVRENSKNTLACLLETEDTPSGVLLNKEELRGSLVVGQKVIVETRGPLEIAGSEFVALYRPKEKAPFYTNK